MNNRELKLEVVSPTTIKCGHIQWFALNTKLVGKTKALIEENERLNGVINEIEAVVYADISNIDCRITIQEILDKAKEVKKDEI